MDTKAAAFGDADFVMPFSAIGLDTFTVEPEREKIEQAAEELLKAKYGLIIIAENTAKLAGDIFEDARKASTPCVVTVPFTAESDGFASESLGRAIKLATGIDILTNK